MSSPEEMKQTIRSYGYGRILQRIDEAKEYGKCHEVFYDLLLDNRGDRRGFPTPVYRAILGLYTEFCFKHNEIDKWSNLFAKKINHS